MPSLNITNSTNVVDNTSTSIVAGDNSSAASSNTELIDTSAEQLTHNKETGQFCVSEGVCFDVTSAEGRQALLEHMAQHGGQGLDELEAYINKHHPGEDIQQIIADEIINTILAGFISGRVGTGGVGPLTADDTPPAIDIKVDEATFWKFLKFAVSISGHGFNYVIGAITGGVESLLSLLPRLPGSLTNEEKKQLEKGFLVPKDSFWGRAPAYLHSWLGYKDHKDGTVSIGGATGAFKAGEVSGEVIALIIGPGKAKQATRAVVGPAIAKFAPKARDVLMESLIAASKRIGSLKVGSRSDDYFTLLRREAMADKAGNTLISGVDVAAKLAGKAAPLAAEWTVAEELAEGMFDKYGAQLSEENRKKWATWFAFNYVWADLTVQLIDKFLGVIYSLRGNRKDDVKTIGGMILKVIVAEILTGSQIIGGIAITKIQNGEISPEELAVAIMNANLDILNLSEPISLNEIFDAISGEEGVDGKDFDVINFEGKSYTIQPPHTIIDDQGKKVPRGSALGNRIWAAWQERYGSDAVGNQVIERNKGGLIAAAKQNSIYRAKGGLIAY